MRERIEKTGRKILLFAVVFFLGFIVSPPGFNFWDFLGEVSHNPEIMKAVLYGVAVILIIAAILYIVGQLKKGE